MKLRKWSALTRTAMFLVWVTLVPPLGAADEGEETRKTPTPTEEGPILSLLLLPVNVLVKLASLLAPGEPPKSPPDAPRAGQPAP